MTTEQVKAILKKRNTPEDRFALSAIALRERRGGSPTAAIEDGRIVFTYPDGTRTCGGVEIGAKTA